MTRRHDDHALQEAFADLMRLLPEATVRAMEIDRVLREYDETLNRLAEERLREREEPITDEAMVVEMSRINAEEARALAKDCALGRGIFAEYARSQTACAGRGEMGNDEK